MEPTFCNDYLLVGREQMRTISLVLFLNWRTKFKWKTAKNVANKHAHPKLTHFKVFELKLWLTHFDTVRWWLQQLSVAFEFFWGWWVVLKQRNVEHTNKCSKHGVWFKIATFVEINRLFQPCVLRGRCRHLPLKVCAKRCRKALACICLLSYYSRLKRLFFSLRHL